MSISESLHLSGLSIDEQRVLATMYAHQQNVEASQNWRVYKRVYAMNEEALSPNRLIEQALFEKGLVCRSQRGEDYAYAISFDGYEWYQRESARMDQQGATQQPIVTCPDCGSTDTLVVGWAMGGGADAELMLCEVCGCDWQQFAATDSEG